MKNFITSLSILAITLSSAAAFSNARDSDGTRIQARSIALGSTVKDKVNPPVDKVDWFYFRIKESTTVQFRLSTNGNPARLNLSNTVGKSIFSGATKKRSFASSKTLKPGIYYVSVSAKSGATYSLSIK